jgi:hypothetical protein
MKESQGLSRISRSGEQKDAPITQAQLAEQEKLP